MVPDAVEKLQVYLKNGLMQVEKIFSNYGTAPPQGGTAGSLGVPLPLFDSFSHWRGLVISDPRWATWADTLNAFGNSLREIRLAKTSSSSRTGGHQSRSPFGVTQDYDIVVRSYLQGHQPSKLDLDFDIFGLPIIYRPHNKSPLAGKKATLSYELGNVLGQRRGSPITAHPVRCGKQFAVIVQLFESKFIPPGAQEVLSGGNKKISIKEADYSVIKNRFFTALANRYTSYPI